MNRKEFEFMLKPYKIDHLRSQFTKFEHHSSRIENQQIQYTVQKSKIFEMPPLKLPKILRPHKSEHITPMRFRNARIEPLYKENHSFHKYDCYDFKVMNSNNY